MKIVVAVRCRNEEKNIERFLHGYSFADAILVSDGGSTDNSIQMLQNRDKVKLVHFGVEETINGETWNPDNPHIQYIIDEAKKLEPDWIIMDDMDCVPNAFLRENAREIFENASHLEKDQMNAFRLYLWGDTGRYFPKMNNHFDPLYRSLWAWMPSKRNIRADLNIQHGTILGTTDTEAYPVPIPMCLLHKSWYPDTIDAKVEKYRKIGIECDHPFVMPNAGKPVELPDWAVE